MVRMLCGPALELHGCDVDDLAYPVFFDFAGLKSQNYPPLFVALRRRLFRPGNWKWRPRTRSRNDSESLKELYRIIRPGGHFVMTFLPNKYSYVEWLNRHLKESRTFETLFVGGGQAHVLASWISSHR